ncbi:hypothetical protein K432DRAFT_342291 [Lepidopterella palustris CBS 459.81]|uniref:Glycoside hydrolase subgroup catalytic core protein n=1 Tax=Lepidopterella palustris CBS 459.81 TaxID=1314670 RepID=A0A8E2JKZ9_9PEZI|nr:hypothetical protein K432DRAFT_342291 [Lepidopterella palustris CBS 459.81]
MLVRILLQAFIGLGTIKYADALNNPSGVDTWCGKAYRATDASFEPSGQLHKPNATSETLLLDLKFYLRMNLYLSSDKTGSFIVDAPLSYVSGFPYSNSTFIYGINGGPYPFTTLQIQIANSNTGAVLVPWSNIAINSTDNEFAFNLSTFPPKSVPYPIHLIGVSPDGLQIYQTSTLLTVLPARKDSGSTTRIDRLHGGLHVLSPLTHSIWKPILPFSFYTSWDWIASTITNTSATQNLSTFSAAGFNIIHPIPPGGSDPFNHTLFNTFLNLCDTLELYVMYDMRHTYQNLSSVAVQLALLKSHPSLLLYYTGDEPDGAGDPLDATMTTYQYLKQIDPYHPTSLCLNCANFYFVEYSAGADIVLEDTYPLAANTSFSPVYHTVCNATYGDCGCDNCHAYDAAYPAYAANPFLDIADRLDAYAVYQEWSGLSEQAQSGRGRKVLWGVPQGFYDEGSFWGRYPTAEEEAVMVILRLNHGAKGIVAWDYPTSEEIEIVMGKLASVVAGEVMSGFVLGAKEASVPVIGGKGLVDASVWVVEGKVLCSVVYMGYEGLTETVEIQVPGVVARVESTLWGEGKWRVENGKLVKKGLRPLEVGIFVLGLKGY